MYLKSLSSIIESPLVERASRVQRYSSSRLTDPETLAIHNYEVCMMGLLLIDRLKEISPEEVISESTYLLKAISHDLEEVSTGDVPRPLKYSSVEVRESLQKVADISATVLFNDNFYDASRWKSLWKSAKEGKEGHLLKLVDLLTVLRKSVYEVDTLNNKTLLDVVANVLIYFKQLIDKKDSFLSVYTEESTRDYLLSLLEESYQVAMKCLSNNNHTLRDQR